MLGMLEAIGVMTRMTDPEARHAWADLLQRSPTLGFGRSLGVLYLWARMTRMGESAKIPGGWGAEQYQQAVETEMARGDLPGLHAKLQAGGSLTEAERRAVLTDAMTKDPAKAVGLWCRSTRPDDYRNDGKWLAGTLSNPETRAGIMSQLRSWQGDGDLPGVVSMLARDWVSSDPLAVEKWLQEPAQADVRDLMMKEVANARSLTDPAAAMQWSQSLSGQVRLQALGTSAMQLASRHPDIGIQLIAGLHDQADRQAAVRNFANIFAAQDYEKWQSWRDSLPPVEQSVANESAFPLWVNRDVEKATGWLNSQPAGEARDQLVSVLVNYYAGKDPETSAEWIRTIPDPSRRRTAAAAALSNVGPQDLDQIRTILSAMEK